MLDFDQALKINLNNDWALANWGETYRLMERYPQALLDFDEALKLNPKDAWSFSRRGKIYLLLKQYNQSLTDFNQAIELDSNGDWYGYSRALVSKVLNQSNKAQADLTQAVKLAKQSFEKDPKNWNNTFNLAIYYLAAQHYQKAEKLYNIFQVHEVQIENRNSDTKRLSLLNGSCSTWGDPKTARPPPDSGILLYKYALANGANSDSIKEAVQDLKYFLQILSDNLQAQAMQKLLQSSLS